MLGRFIIISFFAFSLNANPVLKEFLKSTNKLHSLEKLKLKKEIFNDIKFDKTMIEKLRVSAEYSRFDKDEMDAQYDLRIYPKTFSKRDKQMSEYELVKEQVYNSYEKALAKALKKHYELLFDAYYMKKFYQSYKDILELEKKQLDVSLESTDTISDIVNLVKIKNSIKKTEFKLKEIEQNLNTKVLKIQYYIPDTNITDIELALEEEFMFDSSLIVDYIESKKEVFLEISEKSIKNEQLELNLAKNKMELNKIEEGLKIHSIDLSYENNDDFDKSLSVGISLEKVWPGSNSLGRVNDKIKLLKAQNSLASAQNDFSLEVSTLFMDIKRQNSNLAYINENLKNDNFLKIFQELKNQDPLKLLVLQISQQKAKKDALRIEKEIYKKFVELLYITHNLTNDFLFKKEF